MTALGACMRIANTLTAAFTRCLRTIGIATYRQRYGDNVFAYLLVACLRNVRYSKSAPVPRALRLRPVVQLSAWSNSSAG